MRYQGFRAEHTSIVFTGDLSREILRRKLVFVALGGFGRQLFRLLFE